MNAARYVCLLALAACGFQAGALPGDDAAVRHDGTTIGIDARRDDSPPGETVKIGGTVYTPGPGGNSGVGGASVTALASASSTMSLGSATAASNGVYSISVPAGFSGVLRVTSGGFYDTYQLVVPAFLGNAGVNIELLNSLDVYFGGQACNTSQVSTSGLVGLLVVDTNMDPLAGATFTVTPTSGTSCYVGSNGNLSGSATSTSAAGTGLVFNVTAGSATLSAAKTGDTFAALAADVVAGAYTTALIQQQ